MHEDSAFLAALVDQPEDDLLRAVYADWLEERGDPRADYLRTEMILVEMRDDDPGYAKVEGRLRELREQIDAHWLDKAGRRYRLEFDPPKPHTAGLGLLAGLFGGVDLTLVRGMFNTVAQTLMQPLPRAQAEQVRDAVLDRLPWPAIRPQIRIRVWRTHAGPTPVAAPESGPGQAAQNSAA